MQKFHFRIIVSTLSVLAVAVGAWAVLVPMARSNPQPTPDPVDHCYHSCPVIHFTWTRQEVDVAEHYIYADKIVDVAGHWACPNNYTEGTQSDSPQHYCQNNGNHHKYDFEGKKVWIDPTDKCPSGYGSNPGHDNCRQLVPTTYKPVIHSADVAYSASGGSNNCHRPSDNDLEHDYGMDSDARGVFKQANAESVAPILTPPTGYFLSDGVCRLISTPTPTPPTDVCSNIPGNQASLPDHMAFDGNSCYCVQGYHINSDYICMVDSTPTPTPTPSQTPSPTPTPTYIPPVCPQGRVEYPVETVSVPANAVAGVTTSSALTNDVTYILRASGTWTNSGGIATSIQDAEYLTYDNWANYMDGDSRWDMNGYQNELDLQVDNGFVNWGPYNTDHVYALAYTGTGALASFRIFDGNPSSGVPTESWYGDNSGTMTVSVNECRAPSRRRRVHDEDANAMQLIAMGMGPTGGIIEGGVPTPTESVSPTPTPSESPAPTASGSVEFTPTPTPTESVSPTPTPSETPVIEETPTPTPPVIHHRQPTPTPEATESVEPSPSETPNDLTGAIGNQGFFGSIWHWLSGLFR